MIITADDYYCVDDTKKNSNIKVLYQGVDITSLVTDADIDAGWADVLLFGQGGGVLFSQEKDNFIKIRLNKDLIFENYEAFLLEKIEQYKKLELLRVTEERNEAMKSEGQLSHLSSILRQRIVDLDDRWSVGDIERFDKEAVVAELRKNLRDPKLRSELVGVIRDELAKEGLDGNNS